MDINLDPYFIVPILKSCAELSFLYPRDNAVLSEKLESVVSRLTEIMGPDPTFSILFENGTISINSKIITNNQFKRPQAQWLLILAGKNQIGEIIFHKGANSDDLYHLGKVMHEASIKRVGCQALEEIVAAKCRGMVQLIHISGVVAVKKPESASEVKQESRSNDLRKSAPLNEAFKGSLKPSQEVSPQRLFELPESDKRTLIEYVQGQVQRGNFPQLLQNVTDMLRDMNSFDLEISFLGANSLKVVIEALVNLGQVEFLFKVSEEVFSVLPGIPRDDILKSTVEIQLSILRVFRMRQLLPPYLYGIRRLAVICKTQQNQRLELIKNAINHTLDPKITSFLLSQMEVKHPASEQIIQLFSQFNMQLSEPLFVLLFHSQKRVERKQILALLTQAGEAIMPMVIHHLKLAIKKESPWYVKRNLLFLLCRFPTNDLAPLIDEISKDRHVRLQEQLLQACLRLKSPKAVEFGIKEVADIEYDKLHSVLPVISQFKNRAYDQVLIQKFYHAPDESFQIKIMHVIAELDTNHTRTFFEDILSARKMVSFRYSDSLRGEAAKAMYHSEGRNLFKLLFSLKDDKVSEVRHWAQKYVVEKSSLNTSPF